MGITTEAEAKKIVDGVRDAKFHIKDITVKDVRRNPSAPFTTSTLQQEAARKLGFSAKQTMMIAQHLYENGFITYMRTDSVNLAESALAQARAVITDRIRRGICAPRTAPLRHKKQRRAGSARSHPPDESRRDICRHHSASKIETAIRLYDLIWKRTIASQMKEALLEQTAVDIEAETAQKEIFRANGQTVKFDGFIRVYTEGRDDDASDEIEGRLPKLEDRTAAHARRNHCRSSISPNRRRATRTPRS